MFNGIVNNNLHPIFALANKYNVPISQQERNLIDNKELLQARLVEYPELIVLEVGSILEPLRASPMLVDDKVINFVFWAARIKRNVDNETQTNLADFHEYYYDEAFSEAVGTDEGYRHHVAKVHAHCMLAELAIYQALYSLTVQGMYIDDFLFPYQFVKLIDATSAIFAKINDPSQLR